MVQASKKRKLLEKAKNSPNNLRFSDLRKLAEYFGWVFNRQNGTSHAIYFHPALPGIMNFQDRKGKAKPTQVKQLLNAIEELPKKFKE